MLNQDIWPFKTCQSLFALIQVFLEKVQLKREKNEKVPPVFPVRFLEPPLPDQDQQATGEQKEHKKKIYSSLSEKREVMKNKNVSNTENFSILY